ncbi:MAG TPA: AbrB/MazE/SpoVT family DNA-binding domain-containing protein [Jatrophihabitans sp.]|jgi:AbrB family looped-hinge helix DNA binding protein|nr:AbrB/MazE/SpoVT family DNA-binding domain-containing protein [Jatrophihabitans sp.]
MEAKVDSVGRVLIPKKLREALGLHAGSTVDISFYGGGLQITPGGRTARLVEEDGLLVASGTTEITDEIMYALIDAGRK